MANIIKGMRTYLLTKTAVTDLVGNRVYFGNLPQKPQVPTYPAVVLHLIDSESVRRHAATAGLVRSVVQVDCHDDDFTVAENVSEQIRLVTESQAERTWGAETARRAYITGRRDLSEPPVDSSQLYQKVRSLDVTVWHTEAAVAST